MKRTLAFLAAMAMCVSSVPMAYTSAANAVPVTAEKSAFNESEYFVVVGTYHSRDGENYTQLRYENGGSAGKVAWKNAPDGLTYGDILVAEGKFKLDNVREYSDEPVYAMASVNYLNDDAVLRKVGHCTELMERKKLTVTSTMYDGSGHFSIYLEDENGKEYYYGLSTVGSSLGVNLAYDAEYGDNVTFMFCNGNISIPLEVAKPLVPSWVPKSFVEAMEFYNEYGVTHISKGNNICDVVCLVFPESASSSKNYEIRTTESVNKIYHKTFESPIGDTKYEVVAYYDDCKSPTSFSIDLNCNDEIQWSYVFDCDG
ncbi:MAG: hypothetical protein MJ071_06760, partial [Oscillospiraceae bacterium]|nr:hypothetical protein [Oscillospiraceae bacterium]